MTRTAALLFTLLTPPALLPAATFHPIALTGESAPGTDKTYAAFDYPVINDAGQVAFTASMYKSFSISLDRVLYLASPGNPIPHYIARHAETHGGVELSEILNITLSNTGAVAFTSYVGPGPIIAGTPNALFSATPGSVNLVAREGSTATPGGETLPHAAWPVINDSNLIAFNGGGVPWTGNPATQTRLAYVGQFIPELGGSITHVSSNLPMISAAGQVPVVAAVNGNTSLFLTDGSTRTILATNGQPVPGAPADVTFDGFNAPRINSAGRVATTGYVWGPSVTFDTSSAIFATTDSEPLALVARAGDPAPGAPAGVLLDDFYEANISDDNRIGFFATLRGPTVDSSNNFAIFAGAPGDLRLLARSGDLAPHTAGALFDYADWPVLNASGQSLFKAWFKGPSITPDNDEAAYLADPDGTLHLLARSGDPLTLSPADTRIISGVDFITSFISGGADGQPRSLNNAGQVALHLSFTDNSEGIFLLTIPEPVFAACGLALLPFIRRRSSP